MIALVLTRPFRRAAIVIWRGRLDEPHLLEQPDTYAGKYGPEGGHQLVVGVAVTGVGAGAIGVGTTGLSMDCNAAGVIAGVKVNLIPPRIEAMLCRFISPKAVTQFCGMLMPC